ncbi:beta-carotene isomerase [Salix suchowensis]|nr:beta-carotene isomerase [Salix suchowensis]
MDARFLCQTRSPVPSLPRQNRACKLKHRSPALAFLTRRADNVLIQEKKACLPTEKLAGLTKKTVYNDSWLAKLAINYLSQRFQDATGMRNSKRDYESLTQTARDAWRKFSPTEQHELVLQSLNRAIPAMISNLVKIMLPQCTFTREYFAAFTTLFFVWLVGPCEVRESDFNGRKEKNVVHIKKCRFLEATDCVGMCTNLCKVPSQTFIKHSFGIPVDMVPDFDDMSCEMIYGQEPPKITEDPAFKQPCYKLCKENRKHGMQCSG